jgi:hypothetical protein
MAKPHSGPLCGIALPTEDLEPSRAVDKTAQGSPRDILISSDEGDGASLVDECHTLGGAEGEVVKENIAEMVDIPDEELVLRRDVGMGVSVSRSE